MKHYSIITPGTIEPLTLAEVRNYLRIDDANVSDNGLIEMHLAAARERFEKATGLILMPTVYDAVFDSFPDNNEISLFKLPVSAVTSITYYDGAGEQQTLTAAADLYTDLVSKPARITPVLGYFPAADGRPGGVAVRFTAGYASANNVPKLIKQALLVMIAHFYENRIEVVTGTTATTIPNSVEMIIEMFQIREHR